MLQLCPARLCFLFLERSTTAAVDEKSTHLRGYFRIAPALTFQLISRSRFSRSDLLNKPRSHVSSLVDIPEGAGACLVPCTFCSFVVARTKWGWFVHSAIALPVHFVVSLRLPRSWSSAVPRALVLSEHVWYSYSYIFASIMLSLAGEYV